jgi:DNA-directed RNA polymerase specialized sigma24 family protein
MYIHSDDGFEIFRRAIVERDQFAWATIHARYRLLMIAWARQSSVSLSVSEQFEDIADQAFARAWSALTPMRFAEFPGLAALLGYLRSCVSTVLIDIARAQSTRERTIQKLNLGTPATPEQIVLDTIDQKELWKLVTRMIETPQEALILHQSIVLGVPPRLLLARYPHLFQTIDDVYATKRNFTGRLQRNRELQRLMHEFREE